MSERSQAHSSMDRGPPTPLPHGREEIPQEQGGCYSHGCQVHQQILIVPTGLIFNFQFSDTGGPRIPEKCLNSDRSCHSRSRLISKVARDENSEREVGEHSSTAWRDEILSPAGTWLYCSLSRLISPSCTAISGAFSQQRIWNLIVSSLLSPESISWPWN